jgi:hypothetical protein
MAYLNVYNSYEFNFENKRHNKKIWLYCLFFFFCCEVDYYTII